MDLVLPGGPCRGRENGRLHVSTWGPIQENICLLPTRAAMASLALKKIAPILASAALNMTVLMICAVLSTAPLFAGIGESFDKKEIPPAHLRALGLFK